jgi:hypothetical protein
MAKELFEIKSFMSGTIITPSERDIKEDAASYSLNLDSVTEDGKLKSIPTDLYLAVEWGPAIPLTGIVDGVDFVSGA